MTDRINLVYQPRFAPDQKGLLKMGLNNFIGLCRRYCFNEEVHKQIKSTLGLYSGSFPVTVMFTQQGYLSQIRAGIYGPKDEKTRMLLEMDSDLVDFNLKTSHLNIPTPKFSFASSFAGSSYSQVESMYKNFKKQLSQILDTIFQSGTIESMELIVDIGLKGEIRILPVEREIALPQNVALYQRRLFETTMRTQPSEL